MCVSVYVSIHEMIVSNITGRKIATGRYMHNTNRLKKKNPVGNNLVGDDLKELHKKCKYLSMNRGRRERERRDRKIAKSRFIDWEAEVSTDSSEEEEEIEDDQIFQDPKLADFLDQSWASGESATQANRLVCIRRDMQEERGMWKHGSVYGETL